MVMEKITFVTGNLNKVRELENYLGVTVMQKELALPEMQSLDVEEVAKVKAQKAYELLGVPALVEDTALTFLALGKLPGPFIKYFLESIHNDGLVKLLNNFENREVVATTCFALADESGVQTFVGETLGVVADKPRGEDRFGWDMIFIPMGYTETWAEMSLEEKQKTSMRRKALDKLQKCLIYK